MKYCKHCGSQMEDDAVVCVNCGCAADPNVNFAQPANTQSDTMQTVAKVFMIIGCALGAFCFLIPLAWMLPMTLHYCNAIKEHRPVGIGFKICSLLFVSMLGGIFMLLDTESNQ